jgi:hypothetical protein
MVQMSIRITDVEMVLPAEEEIVATSLHQALRGRQRRGILSTQPIPPFRDERLAESSADVGESIEGGGVDAAGVEKGHNDTAAFRPSVVPVSNFVRNTVQRVDEFSVAAIPVVWFGEVRRPSMRPATCCGEARLLGMVSHAPQGLGG